MGRTLLVGDVHGCHDELASLVAAAKLTKADRLVLVGDLVARGPESGKVVEFARAHDALRVRGNHEAHLLNWRHGERNKLPPSGIPKRLSAAHQKAADQLSEADWAYLEAAPVTLDLPEHAIRVVHAGMDPRLPWSEQAVDVLITIRHVKNDDDAAEAIPWGSLYQGPPHVVFGHDARAGLQIHAWCTGLDTGCVYGGMLTGMLLEAGQTVPADPTERTALLLSVPAARRYYAVK
jgi:hypothetical protein